jgi:serpin B
MRKVMVVCLAAALLTAACGEGAAPEDGAGTTAGEVISSAPPSALLLASDLDRGEAGAPAGDLAAVAGEDGAFGAALLAALGEGSEANLAVSPLSIRLVLAMAYAGAGGETANQMAEVLGYGLPADRLHSALNALDLAIEDRTGTFPGEEGEDRSIEVSISNALWGQAGFPIRQDFLDTLAQDYGAGLRLVDFATAAEAAREAINAWVAGETNDRIPELIPAGVLDAQTLLVLTNTVYLLADWALPFDSQATADGAFTRLDGTTVTAPLMHQLLVADYAAGEGWQAVDLPYVGGQVSMVVVVPDGGRYEEIAAAAASLFGEARAALASADVQLTLPRFEFRTQASLPETLRSLGMVDAFVPGAADFTGISAEGGLFISDVIHEVFVSVNEAGTEAAAATAVVMGRGAPPVPVELSVDRPFLFWLYDRPTGAVLFMGRVVDPSA